MLVRLPRLGFTGTSQCARDTVLSKVRWPSGLRRQTKVVVAFPQSRDLVRKGVGSNPTLITSFCLVRILGCRAFGSEHNEIVGEPKFAELRRPGICSYKLDHSE